MEKKDDERLKEIFDRMRVLEEQYKEMTKEDLINIMVFKDMMNEAFEIDEDKHEVKLWCYVSDETGVLYISDTQPVKYVSSKGNLPGVYLSDGEVNVRVPDALRPMFPDLKHGDEPVRFKLSVSF